MGGRKNDLNLLRRGGDCNKQWRKEEKVNIPYFHNGGAHICSFNPSSRGEQQGSWRMEKSATKYNKFGSETGNVWLFLS